MIGVGVIGCGLIGTKRVAAMGEVGQLVACTDHEVAKAQRIAKSQTEVVSTWQELLNLQSVEAVVIATQHDSLATITQKAIAAGKHVLVEKPAARSHRELLPVLELSKHTSAIVRVGFNHRYHRALQKAKQLLKDEVLGELMFLRGRYGHGGRLGYDQEWRADVTKSGGGELIDQGPHLIDLSRWILQEEFSEIQGFAQTCFWEMPVDDNAFLLLRTSSGQAAFLHASCTEWKNTFSFELYGQQGKLQIDGIGGSYGVERLTWYRMLPQMGPPETMAWEYPMLDNSWDAEMEAFYQDISLNRQPEPGLRDAVAVLDVVAKIYERSGYDHRA